MSRIPLCLGGIRSASISGRVPGWVGIREVGRWEAGSQEQYHQAIDKGASSSLPRTGWISALLVAVHNRNNWIWRACLGKESLTIQEFHAQKEEEIKRRMSGLGRERKWMKGKMSPRTGRFKSTREEYLGFLLIKHDKISRHGSDCREGRSLLCSQFPQNRRHATPGRATSRSTGAQEAGGVRRKRGQEPLLEFLREGTFEAG